MQAEPGDWLVVKSATEGRPMRRAVITAVGVRGGPPFTVRWCDTDHESLIFPGPDAEVVPALRQVELDRAQDERLSRLQTTITARLRHDHGP